MSEREPQEAALAKQLAGGLNPSNTWTPHDQEAPQSLDDLLDMSRVVIDLKQTPEVADECASDQSQV